MTAALVALFLASLAVTLAAAGFFARRLDRVGFRLGLPETVLGLLTAVAADSPEISAAITALVKGEHSAGVGVVVGSNVFNLAAMIGGSALLAGLVHVRRESLAVEGAVGVGVLLPSSALVVGWLTPAAAAAIIAVVLVPYVIVLALGPQGVERLPFRGRRFLHRMFGGEHRRASQEHVTTWHALSLVPALALIVAGSALMVEAAVRLGDRWSVPDYLIGVLVLAVLTSLPNAYTGIRLGVQGRGSALLSETLNSNTINLVAGIAIPALVLSLGTFSGLVAFDLTWLIATTLLVLALLVRGVGRAAGGLVVGLYLVFVAVQIGFGR
ncbi:MAG: sodium:calcium antiporter [Gaiellaceae bacterium]